MKILFKPILYKKRKAEGFYVCGGEWQDQRMWKVAKVIRLFPGVWAIIEPFYFDWNSRFRRLN